MNTQMLFNKSLKSLLTFCARTFLINVRPIRRLSFKGAHPGVKRMLVWTYEEGTWDGRVYSSVADVSWVLSGPPPPPSHPHPLSLQEPTGNL